LGESFLSNTVVDCPAKIWTIRVKDGVSGQDSGRIFDEAARAETIGASITI